MTQPNTLRIDNVEYVRKDSISQEKTGPLKIVVLDRGFVYIGMVTIQDGFIHITKAKNIRIWGTTKGLGELSINGPTPTTKMDDTGTVEAPLSALMHFLNVNEAKWVPHY